MACIKADHTKFASVASEFDNYVTKLKSQMQKANIEITYNLPAHWRGTDYVNFKNRWEGVQQSGATFEKMCKAIENYAKFLRTASDKYKQVQQDAANRANDIRRW